MSDPSQERRDSVSSIGSSQSLFSKGGPASASKVMEAINTLKSDMEQIKVTVEKISKNPAIASSSGHDIDGEVTRRPSAYNQMPVQTTKGQAAPAGMTPDQQAEFKKQALLVSTLQQKIKDLEAKLTDAHTFIKDGEDRMREMSEREEEMGKDIFKTIDTINNSLSEKIAKQRTEVQKLAGDEYKPINYDPFNYGEAYGGDLVDFQARKRIIELKLLLQGLAFSINQIKDSIKVSPSIDLGYKIVRMDQLLAATDFDKVAKSPDDGLEAPAVLLNQEKSRKPSVVHYPRKEMFQADEEAESKWSITDSIMQTMYRLEVELGEIQNMMGTSASSNTGKALEEIQASLKHLKDTKLDAHAARILMDEWQDEITPGALPGAAGLTVTPGNDKIRESRMNFHGIESIFVPQEKFDGMLHSINSHIRSLMSRLKSMEDKATNPVMGSCCAKTHGVGKSCLACDRPVDMRKEKTTGTNMPVLGEFGRQECKTREERLPPKLRYLLNKGYEINVNGEVMSVYQVPRPCGSGYTAKWPKESKNQKKIEDIKDQVPTANDNFYIKGADGKLYMGDRHFDRKKWAADMHKLKNKNRAQPNAAGIDVGPVQGKVHTVLKYKGQSTRTTEDAGEFMNKDNRDAGAQLRDATAPEGKVSIIIDTSSPPPSSPPPQIFEDASENASVVQQVTLGNGRPGYQLNQGARYMYGTDDDFNLNAGSSFGHPPRHTHRNEDIDDVTPATGGFKDHLTGRTRRHAAQKVSDIQDVTPASENFTKKPRVHFCDDPICIGVAAYERKCSGAADKAALPFTRNPGLPDPLETYMDLWGGEYSRRWHDSHDSGLRR